MIDLASLTKFFALLGALIDELAAMRGEMAKLRVTLEAAARDPEQMNGGGV